MEPSPARLGVSRPNQLENVSRSSGEIGRTSEPGAVGEDESGGMHQALGRMLWLTRNTFAGSQRSLTSTSRAWRSAP